MKGKRPSGKTLTVGARLVVTPVAGKGGTTGFTGDLLLMTIPGATGDEPWCDSCGQPLPSSECQVPIGEELEVLRTAWRSPLGGTWVTVKRLSDGTAWGVWPVSLRERTRYV